MESKKIVNRERVIEVAATLFLEKGFVYTSMDEIVRVSKVSKSNVYYHFSNKEELLEEVIDFWASIYIKNLETIASQNDLSIEKRVLLFLETLSTEVEHRNYKGGCPFITLAIQAPKNAPSINEKVNQFFVELSLICEKLIEEGIRRKEFKQNLDPKKIANLFITNLEGALFLSEIKKTNYLIITTAQQLFKLLVTE